MGLVTGGKLNILLTPLLEERVPEGILLFLKPVD
jgi:hypothetical protein